MNNAIKEPPMNQLGWRNLLPMFFLLIIFYFVFTLIPQNARPKPRIITFSIFLDAVEREQVEKVTIMGHQVVGMLRTKEQFATYAPEYPDLVTFLRSHHVDIASQPPPTPPWYKELLVSPFPLILFFGIWIFLMGRMQAGTMGGANKVLSFGKSKAKLNADTRLVTFKDVAGIDEARQDVEEIVLFLRNPSKFTRLGGRIPKGVLLVGAPGTGKTLLARAIAGEAKVPFFSISGSDFVEMFVGVGASRVRDLFVQGQKSAPCIIFIDEIDAVGRHRGAGLGGGHDEREQTLNQLLVQMDGFETNTGVVIIAASNRPDVLDPALLRPGRFDRRVMISRPDVKGREQILTVHTKNVPLADDVNLSVLARGTPGFVGADLENLVNEAALLAAHREKNAVSMHEFEAAKDKVMMGSERNSMIISDEEKCNTAYHETGHALVAKLIPGSDPVHKVTIIPRGMALGLTQQLPIDDRYTYGKESILANLTILFGGRAAEEIIFHEYTTGAANDLEKATELARRMICEWGMSDLGTMTFGKKQGSIFLGRDFSQVQEYSDRTALLIDQEVKKLTDEAYARARKLLGENEALLRYLAQHLLERETLDGAELDRLIVAFQKSHNTAC